MSRLPRIYLKEAAYFITCRGEHNETIFKDGEDYKMFLDLMKKYQEQYGIKVFAFCLMPDHLHLLVEMEKTADGQEAPSREPPSRSQAISDFMHDLNNNYTKYFNGRYNRKGHLFRERFKSALVEKESSLLKMTAYLHLNPQRSGLVDDAGAYPYSSYQMYLYDQDANQQDLSFMRQAVAEALGLLNNKNYAEFIQELTPEDGHVIHKRLQRGGILGSEDFIKRVKEAVDAYQASGEVQKYEIEDRKNARLYYAVGGLVLILLAGAGGVFFISIKRPLPVAVQPVSAPAESKLDNFRANEWQIKLTPFSGTGESGDILSFAEGRFVSAKLNAMGFPSTNYSVYIQDNKKVIWETLQSSPGGTASWRGEVENDTMSGVLSLRETGKAPQDFSFVSIGQRRKIQ
ncbi:MAG: transposase [Candidatus Omnitrophica bacterium]|nr:transposase [Candidatus Omnitrophota bacterium]